MVPISVVLFSGGRGSGALTHQLLSAPAIHLTLAINGYDDGASTGEVRRLLGDALGPSDFRKNASRLAKALNTCSPALIDALDVRLPVGATIEDARQAFISLQAIHPDTAPSTRRFSEFVADTPFNYSDCSVGNLVFAGVYLESDRRFNEAVDHYCSLLGLPIGLIENVTDGTNAWLVGIDASGRLLASEEEIVDTARPNNVREIYLLDRPLSADERHAIELKPEDGPRLLAAREAALAINPRLAAKIAAADLIIYAPGTQHSSLFPSYLTPGLAEAIAANLTALKIKVTNIQEDAEISGSSAVTIIERAVFYLTRKGRENTPTPCLITHYLINDPRAADAHSPYVPLGPIDSIEDQRLVRIANYEDGATGQHDAMRVLAPFLESIQRRGVHRRVAVLLQDAHSANKVAQTLLEMVRGGINKLAVDLHVYYLGAAPLDPSFTNRLPFEVTHLAGGERTFPARRAAADLTTSCCLNPPAPTAARTSSTSAPS